MTMMPGVQIVNMRPSTPTAPAQQKTVATVSPRVVIGSSHMVGARPGQTNSVCGSSIHFFYFISLISNSFFFLSQFHR